MALFGKNNDVCEKVFDYDAYWDDISHGISLREQKRKFKRDEYYATKHVVDCRKK